MQVFSFFLAVLFLGRASAKYEILEINAQNVNAALSKQPLLLEFYAPWCIHCKNFAEAFENVADILSSEHNISVGKVEISSNPALSALFNIKGIPTFFIYRDGQIWKFTNYQELGVEELVTFARSGYSNEKALSFWSSPMGPIGRFKLILIILGDRANTLLPALTEKYGISSTFAIFIFAMAIVFFILCTTMVGVYFSVFHSKIE